MNRKALILVYEENAYNDLYDVLFADLLKEPDVFKIVEKSFPEHGFFKYLNSKKLNKLTFGLARRLYLHYYMLPKKLRCLCQEYDSITVLFHNASLRRTRYPEELFQMMKQKNVRYTLLYLDSCIDEVVCGYANILREKEIFDEVFTIDPLDAQQFRMKLCLTPYSKIDFEERGINQHLFFCGQNKGRMYQLYQIWQGAKKNDVEIRFDLTFCREFQDFFENDLSVHFHDRYRTYQDTLIDCLSSNCILDIVQKGQNALTLRPYEAVVYNKKLLTNNKNIYFFKYYDERYMRYFEKIDDIDWEWVRKEETVNYGYQGDFSPSFSGRTSE